MHAWRFGLFRVRSPLLAESLLFSLPGGTEMVHFPPLPSPPYVFRWRYDGITRRGFPHSDISGSKLVCSSPKRFAADRVLHRLLAPRHSPCALSSLTIGNRELAPHRSAMNVLRQSLFPTLTKEHLLCLLWIGKTTVCRIFSCQRSGRGKYRPRPNYGSLGRFPPDPLGSFARGDPFAPLRSVALRQRFCRVSANS
jgi:hypothetical protein